jgi:hypothetical protein
MTHAAQALERNGGFEVTLLLGQAMTRRNLISAIQHMTEGSEPHDCSLFYFAGHAGFADQLFSLFVVDSKVDELRSTAISVKELSNRFFRTKVGPTWIVVLDTSFAASAHAEFM